MVGHLNVPALDNSGTPASLSKKITTDLLKSKMGFEGLIFTDALEMKGAKVPGVNNCVQAFIAGADILLASSSPMNDIIASVRRIML
jgi:beta-glucosidase-like glycosyl hydrolase